MINLTDRDKSLMAYTVKMVAKSLRNIERVNANLILDSDIELQMKYHLSTIAAGLKDATEEEVILHFLKLYNTSAALIDGMIIDFEECK